jgi:ABC-type multidrug transport system ATPase subunit
LVVQDLELHALVCRYGLLGASGCGKTTLLSCIVGRRRLNTGEIWVLGGKPGTKGSGVPGKRVGYMPQEIALYGEFSIKETMMYFGWIFGMESPEINERLQFLLNFLDLPSQNRLVKNLSGGQQRRVSFAVALMHDPELLILDEPTVGVDPLLRQSIWNHLVQITKDGNKTVIITTHYIEEARQAHTVSLWYCWDLVNCGVLDRLDEEREVLGRRVPPCVVVDVRLPVPRRGLLEVVEEARSSRKSQ